MSGQASVGGSRETVRERTLLTARKAAVVSGVAALVALTVEMMSLAVIPMTDTFIRDIGMTPVAAGWILMSSLLVTASTAGLLTRLGDIVGHRRVLLSVLCAQVVGNLLVGLATDEIMVLAGRMLGGLSGAIALLLAVMRDWMGSKELRFGIGVVSSVQGIGVSLSFLFGGVLIEAGASWRAVFFALAALALVCLVATWRWVPETVTRAQVALDYLGAGGLAVWLCLLLIAVSKSTSWGLGDRRTWGCVAASLVVAVWWVWFEKRQPEPLVDIDVAFGRRLLPTFVAKASSAFGAFLCYIGITRFVQTPPDIAGYGFGYTVLQGGLVLLPTSLSMTVACLFTGRLVGRFGARPITALGLAVMGVVFVYWYGNHDSVWQLAIGSGIWGVGQAMVFAAGYTVATVEAPETSTGIVNGVATVWALVGSALGVAVSTALSAADLIPGTAIPADGAWSHSFLAGAVACGVGLVAAIFMPRGIAKSIGADLHA